MSNLLKKVFVLFATIITTVVGVTLPSHSQNLPEFVGNYIDCDGKWCPLYNIQLNVLTFLKRDETGTINIIYPGYWGIHSKVIKLKDNKPKILLYSGKSTADPSSTALVELEILPYNNDIILFLDMKEQNNVRYRKENIKPKIWSFKREIPLRYKPIDGKVGMFLYEPAEPLGDGFYALDSGKSKADGHDGLKLKPKTLYHYGFNHIIAATPFIIGNIKDTTSDEIINESKFEPTPYQEQLIRNTLRDRLRRGGKVTAE